MKCLVNIFTKFSPNENIHIYSIKTFPVFSNYSKVCDLLKIYNL